MKSKIIFTESGVSPAPTPTFTSSITFLVDDSLGAINHVFTFLFTATNIPVKIIWGDGTYDLLTAANSGNYYTFSKNFQCPGAISVRWGSADMIELNCYVNNITAVSTLPSTLTFLDINTNKFASVDISGLTALTYFDCEVNLLTAIPVIPPSLQIFDIALNLLTGIFDVSGNTTLIDISCGDNVGLTAVNINGCSALQIIRFNNTLVSSFAPTGVTSLLTIVGSGSALTTLDVTTYTTLRFLYVLNCLSLTTIDIHDLPNLQAVNFTGCPLTSVDAHGCACKLLAGNLVSTSFTVNCIGANVNPKVDIELGNLISIDFTGITNCFVIQLKSNTLSTAEVNNILIALDATGLLNKFLYLELQTPAAPPSGAGATAKTNLIANGWTVTTD